MRMPRRWFRRPDFDDEAFEDGLQRSLERFHGDLLNYPADGPWDEVAYWDPLSAVRLSGGGVGDGRWEDRSRLGVPGPFYAGMTDTGLNGPFYLPAHVLSGEEHCEFVYRQPGGLRELAALVGVAQMEPIGGFNCDGDDYWTPETVRRGGTGGTPSGSGSPPNWPTPTGATTPRRCAGTRRTWTTGWRTTCGATSSG
ncbi:hypothetical protein [Kitasatospora sp. NPDC091276]|uniref:hypothetical protein n=1 Tax=Kitasatospora sp. NPDC091276 TaxID=3155300 RepID=UPI0034464D96